MKTKEKSIIFLTLLLLVMALMLFSCKKDDVVEDQPDITENPQGTDDPDLDPDEQTDPDDIVEGSTSTVKEINAAFTFNSVSFKSGTPPGNSNLGDLKINKDTINIWPGIRNRIEILNHTGISIGGVIVHMPGADGYHDVALETEESNDTLAVFYIDLDPEGLDLPLNSGILIKPTDGSDQVVDEFDHPLHLDMPYDKNVPGDSSSSNDNGCIPAFNKELHWIYTTLNNAFSDSPNFPFYQSDYTVEGCCYDGNGTSGCAGRPTNATVDVTEQYAKTDGELMEFFDDGEFAYELEKTFNDYFPDDTDFCSRTPGYSARHPGVYTFGQYSVDGFNSSEDMAVIVINSIEFSLDDLLDTGFGPILKVNEDNPQITYHLGCRYYIESILVEGLDILRVYENVEDFDLWYD
ncbi:MAG: hypothetical protein ACR2MT_16020 [Aurantibacter sp.]